MSPSTAMHDCRFAQAVALTLHGGCPHVEYLRHDFLRVNEEPHDAVEELSSNHETSSTAAESPRITGIFVFFGLLHYCPLWTVVAEQKQTVISSRNSR